MFLFDISCNKTYIPFYIQDLQIAEFPLLQLHKMKRFSSHIHPLFFFIFVVLLLIDHSSAKPTELVDKVCNRTSDYAFCVNSLYSDPRTSNADSYTLAYISFGLAYLNATASHDNILNLLNKPSGASHERLKICEQDYGKATLALEQSFNDLNSETFFTLPELANHGARAASDCQAAFAGSSCNPLSEMNMNLKGLCGICVVVSELFTG
ncbi:pectinesterase inhibitor 5-like [Carica papaya]|uniref:pectinesterase inhibitor 5-like n=1 Tax=Carica papaya TaxID=3649 RepID=UPI000B8C9284|nr:pectinesterase inhibitor 5-like [Carica papaya]